jgi:hypothetical protein
LARTVSTNIAGTNGDRAGFQKGLGWIAAQWSLCGLKFASCYRKNRGRAGVIMDKVQALEELCDKAWRMCRHG